MTMPEFVSPLDDALDDFRLAAEVMDRGARLHFFNGTQKLLAYVRELESRIEAIEKK